jgi:hypothetical protein
MYKKIILFSILFFSFIILIDKAFFNSKEKEIPNPEGHIRYVMVLLQINDLKGFKDLTFPMEDLKKMKKEEGIIFFSGFPNMDESMAEMAWELIQDLDENMIKEYKNSVVNQFKDTRKEIKKGDDFKVEKIQWKLVGNSKVKDHFLCNAKIYIKSNQQHFCVKYKNILYFKGKWYAGNLVDVDEIYEPENNSFLDEYQNPLLEDLMYRSNEMVIEEAQEVIESEVESKDAPKTEED